MRKCICVGYCLVFSIYPKNTIPPLVFDTVKVDVETLKFHVQSILDTDGYRNFYNVAALNQTFIYITNQLVKLGYSVLEHRFIVQGNEFRNIIVKIGNPSGKLFVIGAHYDVCFNNKGADDNASGVAGLLEIARILKERENELTHSFELAFYTLEEPPHFGTLNMGSYLHATELYTSNTPVELMICLKMIGFFTEQNVQDYPFYFMKWLYPTRGNFIAAVGNLKTRKFVKELKSIMNETTSIECQALITPSNYSGLDYSDHLNFWKYKFRALMITDTGFFRNKLYATKYDTFEILDFEKMAEVIKGVSHFILTTK